MLDDVTPREAREAALDDWKRALRDDVERWLATMDEIPSSDEDVDADDVDVPDLYSFHEQLAAATTEARKANRRTADAFSQWSDTLGGLDEQLRLLRDQLARQPVAADDALPRRWCLALAELIDRLRRVADAFAAARVPRRPAWFRHDRVLRAAWETQAQAFDILVSHAEALLASAGVSRLETLHRPFDPQAMVAVSARADAQWPPRTVIEEIAPGYVLRGELLRVAQVVIVT